MKNLLKTVNFFTFALICSVTFLTESFAQDGTIAGTGPKVKKFVAGTARVYSLDSSAVYGQELSSKRSYQFKVPQGGYVVIAEVLGKKESLTKVNVVPVKKGKRTSVRRRALPSSTVPAIRVSVGNIVLKTTEGQILKNTKGKDITVDGLMIVDLLHSKNECGFAIFEDRTYGRFNDILKELRLQASALSANRINFKAATATLKANAPQYRLTGSVEITPDEALTGNATLQIIKLETGEVVWQKSITNGSTDFSNFSEPLAQAAADALCFPQEVSGTFTGTQKVTGSGFAVTYSWIGKATFKFQSYIAEDPSKPEDYTAALYEYSSGEISSYKVSGTNNGCSVSGETSSQQPEPPSTGILLVYLKPDSTNGYRYALSVSLSRPEAVQIVNSCPDNTSTRLDSATAELIVSESDEDLQTTTSLHTFAGSGVFLNTEMSWDFESKLSMRLLVYECNNQFQTSPMLAL